MSRPSFTQAFFEAKEFRTWRSQPAWWNNGCVYILCGCYKWFSLEECKEPTGLLSPTSTSLRNPWYKEYLIIKHLEFGKDYWDWESALPALVWTLKCRFLWGVCQHCGLLHIAEFEC